MYLFLHLPKTAGTTLRVLFGDVYGASSIFQAYQYRTYDDVSAAFQKLTPDQQAKTAFVSAHLPFGLHQKFDGDVRYVTMFRDPVERVVSTYYFLRDVITEDNAIFRGGRKMSLREFVESGVTGEVDNGLVRFVAGANAHVPRGQVTDADLELAKENLRTRFAAIGFVEDFNESLVLFGRKLGWDRVPLYRKENANPGRPSMDKISPSDLEIVENSCRLDMELYQYARQLYEAEIATLGPGFAREVRAYEGAILDLSKILKAEKDQMARESSPLWQMSRKPAAAIGRLRRRLGIGTRLRAVAAILRAPVFSDGGVRPMPKLRIRPSAPRDTARI